MKSIPKYITSVPVQNPKNEYVNVSLGFENNGTMGMYFQDTSELGQDSQYLNKESFPNSALLAWGKYSLWLSMFTRLAHANVEESD